MARLRIFLDSSRGLMVMNHGTLPISRINHHLGGIFFWLFRCGGEDKTSWFFLWVVLVSKSAAMMRKSKPLIQDNSALIQISLISESSSSEAPF